MRTVYRYLLLIAGVVLFGWSCGENRSHAPLPAKAVSVTPAQPGKPIWPETRVDRVKVGRLFEAISTFSPRPAGSAALNDLRSYLQRTLVASGFEVNEESFTVASSKGPVLLKNLIAEKKGDSGQIVYIATHIDTKSIPGVHFLGANDSGSSTAAVLALTKLLESKKTRYTYRLAFFDGEEAFGANITNSDGLYGSRYHARSLNLSGLAIRVRAFILLDMIGDKDLDILHDLNSSPSLYLTFANTARRLGYETILQGGETTIIDDHVPLSELGIPVLDIIDFNYGPGNSYWHTGNDTPKHVSTESISRIIDCVTDMINQLEQE